MLKRFICLANSFKEGGRCLAGIEVNNSNMPVIINGRPKWLRPVCNTAHGEVSHHIAEKLSLLNIIELDVTKFHPQGYQSENVTFNEKSIRVRGHFKRKHLASLCNNQEMIFGNHGKAVSQATIGNLNHSLMLISVTQFEISQIVYEDRPDRRKTRLSFTYNENAYDFPITDPAFLIAYQRDNNLFKNNDQIYLCISLGIVWNDWYYKLVAGIVL